MRVSAITTLLVAMVVTPIASAAELQVSVDTGTTFTTTVDPSAGAGIDTGASDTTSTSANVTTTVPPEYYSLASNLTQSLCDALYNGTAAVIDYFRGQAYHEPVRPEDIVAAVVLSSFKAVLNQKLHGESFQKPLNEFHLALVRFIGPNSTVMQFLSTVTAELQENLKLMIRSFDPIARFYDAIDTASKCANNDKEENAYSNARNELDNMVTNLAKYVADIFCMFLSKAFPFGLLS
ncbi:hypothetical protein [Methanopyrus sp.]